MPKRKSISYASAERRLKRGKYVTREAFRPGPLPAKTFRAMTNARIGGFLGIEKKFYDKGIVDLALTAPADASGGEHDISSTICMNTVPIGDAESQRNGRRITMKSLQVNGHVRIANKINQSALDIAPQCYIACVLDSQTNGAQIVSENVFRNAGANAQLATAPYRNLQFVDRYRVLAVKKIAFMPQESSWDGTNVEHSGSSRPFKFHINLKDLKVTFSGTTEDIANITDNSLHMIAWCDNAGAAPKLNYNSRLRYVG